MVQRFLNPAIWILFLTATSVLFCQKPIKTHLLFQHLPSKVHAFVTEYFGAGGSFYAYGMLFSSVQELTFHIKTVLLFYSLSVVARTLHTLYHELC